ncbi:protein EMSY-LIKE 4 isoform X2 [Senna tora]|uniref:Protein EMSY-LIKE 4 isoform X2 n=1 Tax=Senna tora TaxID=362788 RepID=A0A834WFQ5_9FABA|nr:protein EMSY-LIKE 4 isoform X2 [Senna tora]
MLMLCFMSPLCDHAYRIERMLLTTECHGKRDLMDLEHHIHCLEIEAYSSVLKAFIAQSDLLTWGKEELMTDLRKELNVTDIEHGEILIAVHLDESVKRIREQRLLASHAENYVKLNNPGYASGSMRNSSIIMKTSSPVAYFPQKNMSHCQSSLAPIPIPSSMPPKFKDDRNTTGLAMFSHGNAGKSTEIINHNVPLPSRGRAVKVKHQLKKGFRNSDFGNRKNRTDLIEMRATDWVILDEQPHLNFDVQHPIIYGY